MWRPLAAAFWYYYISYYHIHSVPPTDWKLNIHVHLWPPPLSSYNFIWTFMLSWRKVTEVVMKEAVDDKVSLRRPVSSSPSVSQRQSPVGDRDSRLSYWFSPPRKPHTHLYVYVSHWNLNVVTQRPQWMKLNQWNTTWCYDSHFQTLTHQCDFIFIFWINVYDL